MGTPLFSIITVTFDAGEKLLRTAESILGQTFTDYEVIVKDGGSADGSVERLEELLSRRTEAERGRFSIYREADAGIYDAMNRAAGKAAGRYFYFLNCGDLFYEPESLERAAGFAARAEDGAGAPLIFYGDIYDALRGSVVASNPRMTGFACYRNVPCHQACIYGRELFEERGYRPEYRVRADYEHFLWSFYERDARPAYIPVVLSAYEGGGFSETPGNRRRSAAEHKEITGIYMSAFERFCYRAALLLTLSPLRTRMANSPRLAGFYQKCKRFLYRKK